MDNSNQKSNKEPKQKSVNDQAKTVPASDILNSLKAEFFDPELAEKYQKAQDFAQQEAYGMIIAMCGGK